MGCKVRHAGVLADAQRLRARDVLRIPSRGDSTGRAPLRCAARSMVVRGARAPRLVGRLGSKVGLASDTVALASSPVVASYGGLVRRNPHASFCRDPRSASPSTAAR
jgi:hypothetical protein